MVSKSEKKRDWRKKETSCSKVNLNKRVIRNERMRAGNRLVKWWEKFWER